MQKGDLVKIKSRLRDQAISVYDDKQILRLEAWIYLENYSPNIQTESRRFGNDVAIVLDTKDIHKDGNGIDIIWDRFVKVIFSSGTYGWVQRDFLTKMYEEEREVWQE